jgi:hypothetical protein
MRLDRLPIPLQPLQFPQFPRRKLSLRIYVISIIHYILPDNLVIVIPAFLPRRSRRGVPLQFIFDHQICHLSPPSFFLLTGFVTHDSIACR